MPKRFIYPLLFFFLFISVPGVAQKYLLLSKANSKRRYEIYPGQTLRYKLQGQKDFEKNVIKSLGKDEIYFSTDTVNINDIRVVDITKIDPKKGINLSRWGTAFITSGVLLIIFEGFNDAVVLEQELEISDGVWIASGALVGVGIAMKLLHKRRFKVDQKNSLIQIIEY